MVIENSSRRDFLKKAVSFGALSLLGTGCAVTKLNPKANKKLNFVFILVDDLGWIDTSVYGSKYYQTPNIDKLASEGMLFTDAYAACAVCSPTRASIQTGRYPARLGITDWIRARFQGGIETEQEWEKMPKYEKGKPDQKVICPQNKFWLDHDEVTIAEMLDPAGYRTCHIGKWHLGPENWYPETQGYDENHGGCDYGEPPTYFDPYKTKKCSEGIYNLPGRKEGDYLTDREGDEAVKFIKRNKDKPFFLNMCHYAVHTPLMAKRELIKKYESLPKQGQKDPVYAAMIESVDDSVGKITKTLDELGISDNTVVFFFSDNGGLNMSTNNAPLREGKGWPYEGGIREPLIIRWPNVVAKGTTCCESVISVDFFPTICEMAGVELPKKIKIDGLSIVELLKSGGKNHLDREAIYWHFPHYRNGTTPPYSIIRCGDLKLIKFYGPIKHNEFELYNLKKDISESNDLVGQMPEKVKQLNTKLEAWLKSVGAKMPKPNPDYKAE